ncbi:MAG TPA: DUF3617 family protein [Casimicrobiaceae bacterium]|jgi:hypothetical protein
MIKRPLLFVACALLLPIASAQDYPKLRPGLWEMKRSADRAGPGGQAMKICLDESLQREMYDMGLGTMKGMCSKHDFKLSGNRGTGDFVCTVNGSTWHSKSTMTINGDVGYRTEVDTTFDPPVNGQSTAHTVMEARYTGPCAAGQQPGDVTLPNGQTMNMRNMFKGANR